MPGEVRPRRKESAVSCLRSALRAIILCLAVTGGAAAGGTSPESVILDAGSYWRAFPVWRTELYRDDDGKLKLVYQSLGKKLPTEMLTTAPPPSGWTDPGFDDAGWTRLRGPIPQGNREMAILCLRGRFLVRDPGAVGDLSLTLDYYGGVAVYLNGKEVARGHLPEGEPGADTLATDYPLEVFVSPKGKILRHSHGDPKKYPDRFAKRKRSLSAKLPGTLLRKGVNILAIRLHRSPTHKPLIKQASRGYIGQYAGWSMLQLRDLRLSGVSGSGLVSGTGRPTGPVVWTQNVVSEVMPGDYGEPDGRVDPVRIAACRNGVYSGQVVVGSPTAISGLRAQVSDLQGPGGSSIPSTAVRLRYPRLLGKYEIPRGAKYYSALEDEQPAAITVGEGGAALQPVWMTVRVPREAKAGEYTGKVTVSASGLKPVDVPIRMKVADWVLPDGNALSTHVGLIQSPESVAMQYGVKMWSEEHWKLLERSFTLMAEIGADDLYIPFICRTHFGNPHGMVRWKKNGEGLKPDFSVAERYIDTAVKHLGKVPVVCLYVWEANTGALRYNGRENGKSEKGIPFSLLNPETGELTETRGPDWGTPESREFWKPAIDGMREVLRKRGLEKSMMLGLAGDARPVKACVQDFKSVAPDVKWVVHTHPTTKSLYGIQDVAYGAHVWGARSLSYSRVFEPAYGWKIPYIFTAFPRPGPGGINSLRPGAALSKWRCGLEALVVSGQRGMGRGGVDFWGVIKDKRGRGAALTRRYDIPGMSVSLHDSFLAVLAPGKDGPIPTVHFEMLREGAQDAEARIFIEKALTDAGQKARLGADLAARCSEHLRARAWSMARLRDVRELCPNGQRMWRASAWQDSSEKLYSLAAEVASKLGVKP